MFCFGTWLFLSAASHLKLSFNMFQCENLRENVKNSVSHSKFKSYSYGTKAGAQANGFGFSISQAGPKAGSGQRSGPAWPSFFWLGLARLLASGQSRHITICGVIIPGSGAVSGHLLSLSSSRVVTRRVLAILVWTDIEGCSWVFVLRGPRSRPKKGTLEIRMRIGSACWSLKFL